jgi:hypothetical protein
MDRKALDRPGASPQWQAREGRLVIPRETGRVGYLESMIVLGTMAILAVALGLAVGIPVAMMLRDICISIGC